MLKHSKQFQNLAVNAQAFHTISKHGGECSNIPYNFKTWRPILKHPTYTFQRLAANTQAFHTISKPGAIAAMIV